MITHIPCGGDPARRLLISATLEGIDGSGGILGSAGPTSVWTSCPSSSLSGDVTFDISDIEWMEDGGIFEGVITYEMGHVIGIGYVPPSVTRSMTVLSIVHSAHSWGVTLKGEWE